MFKTLKLITHKLTLRENNKNSSEATTNSVAKQQTQCILKLVLLKHWTNVYDNYNTIKLISERTTKAVATTNPNLVSFWYVVEEKNYGGTACGGEKLGLTVVWQGDRRWCDRDGLRETEDFCFSPLCIFSYFEVKKKFDREQTYCNILYF